MDGVYLRPARAIPWRGEYDVVVGGGGPAGCAAAVTAARLGARTLLLEMDGYLGGAAVSHLAFCVHSTNGRDCEGIWHEFMYELDGLRGVSGFAPRPHFRYRAAFHPEMVKHAWDGILARSGAELLYHAHVTEAILEREVVRGVVVETPGGSIAIRAKVVIDCTGNGTIAAAAGAQWEQGDGQTKYAMACSKLFRLGGFPEEAGRDPEIAKELSRLWREESAGYQPDFARLFTETTPQARGVRIGTNRILRVDPLDSHDLTRAECEGRQIARKIAAFLQNNLPGGETIYLFDTANRVGVRSSRRIKGRATLTIDDVLALRKFPDAVAKASWNIDAPPADRYEDPPPDPRYMEYARRVRQGDYYEIPYGALVPLGLDQLLVAGRCISADHLALASLRIQQVSMATGEAAGAAAVACIEGNSTTQTIDPLPFLARLRSARDMTRKYPFRAGQD